MNFLAIILTLLVFSAPSQAAELSGVNFEAIDSVRLPAEALPAVPVPADKALTAAQAPGVSDITGFLTKFEGQYHVGTNLYFSHAGQSRRAEDLHARIQTFSLRGRDLYISVKGFGEYRLGAIDLDPAGLKDRETREFRLTEKVATSTFYHNWRAPKVGVNFSAGITGFGLFTEVTERTQTAISVKTAAGLDFCHYENMPGRAQGVLYPGTCVK
jgi:hypothetical protein